MNARRFDDAAPVINSATITAIVKSLRFMDDTTLARMYFFTEREVKSFVCNFLVKRNNDRGDGYDEYDRPDEKSITSRIEEKAVVDTAMWLSTWKTQVHTPENTEKRDVIKNMCFNGTKNVVLRLTRFYYGHAISAAAGGHCDVLRHVLRNFPEFDAHKHVSDMLLRAAEHDSWDTFDVLFHEHVMMAYENLVRLESRRRRIPYEQIVFMRELLPRKILCADRTKLLVALTAKAKRDVASYRFHLAGDVSVDDVCRFAVLGAWWGNDKRKHEISSLALWSPVADANRYARVGALACVFEQDPRSEASAGVFEELKSAEQFQEMRESSFDAVAMIGSRMVAGMFLEKFPAMAERLGVEAARYRKAEVVKAVLRKDPATRVAIAREAVEAPGSHEILTLLLDCDHDVRRQLAPILACSIYHYLSEGAYRR